MNSSNNLTIEQKTNQILMCYEAYIYSKLGRHYPVTNQHKFTRKKAKQQLLSLLEEEKIKSEITGKIMAYDKMIMGAGEYHDDPTEYVVPLRHIGQYKSELMQFDLSQPIFRDKDRLQALKQPKGDK